MNNPESIFHNPMFSETQVSKVNVFTGCDMTVDTFYLNPKQALDDISASNGDKCLFFFKGNGKCHLYNNNSESVIDVTEGSIVYIPSGVSCKIKNLDSPMVVVQSSSAVHH